MLIYLIKLGVGQPLRPDIISLQSGLYADDAVLTGLHYKNTRLYANDIKVMVGIHFFLFHKETFICDSHFSSNSENVK